MWVQDVNEQQLKNRESVSNAAILEEVLQRVERKVPPHFKLQQFVAMSPWMGWTGEHCMKALFEIAQISNARTLPDARYFKTAFAAQNIGRAELQASIERFYTVFEDAPRFSVHDVERWLDRGVASESVSFTLSGSVTSRRSFEGVLEDAAERVQSQSIRRLLYSWLGSYFDENHQALWPNPWKSQPLATAWRASFKLLQAQDIAGKWVRKRLKQRVSKFPDSGREALLHRINEMKITPAQFEHYLMALVFEHWGWACFVRGLNFHDPHAKVSFADFLAVVVEMDAVWEGAVSEAGSAALRARWAASTRDRENAWSGDQESIMAYLALGALEGNCRSHISESIKSRAAVAPQSNARAASTTQLVFCIDVRSEVVRRNLEKLHPHIETFGFAGFFGLPIAFQRDASISATPHLPALLKAKWTLRSAKTDGLTEAVGDPVHRLGPVGAWSFVETFGFKYAWNLMNWVRGKFRAPEVHGTTGPIQLPWDLSVLSLQDRASLAEGVLRFSGLWPKLASTVVLIGHGGTTNNNPYRAGYDCGACGGQTGEESAKLAAALLNDENVRSELARRGMTIPKETTFFAGLHHTTTDEFSIWGEGATLDRLRKDLSQATLPACKERFSRWLPEETTHGLDPRLASKQRALDPSEVRPEWGLAGNASMFIGSRELTRNLNLEGRSFLHSYNEKHDPEGKWLELIFSAPMVVAQGINFHYFASTVDPDRFGSGNKATQNVTGGMGTIQGSSGDLLWGLPLQATRWGDTWLHEPLRLQVFVEASQERIESTLQRLPQVRELFEGDWLHLVRVDPETRSTTWYQGEGDWRPC